MTRNFIRPSLFGSDSLSLFGNQQLNPQQQLELETEKRSEELAKEDEMKLRKFEDDVRYRAILAAYRIQGF